VSTSYGKRYSFINAFGVIIEGEDNDALTFDDGVQYAKQVAAISACETREALQAVWSEMWKTLDMTGREVVYKVYDKKKRN
jgi:hypothetical protein